MLGALTALLALLMTIASSVSQECLYQYVQQPPLTISCNPYTSQLQLHCIFIGPLSPLLQIKWYSFHQDTPDHLTPLSQSSDFYTIESIVMDVAIGMSLRSISSILQTGAISEQQTGLCYFCKAEIGGLALPVASNSLCIHEPSYYSGMPLCKDTLMVNTSSQCVPITESFRVQLQQLTTESPTQPSSLNPTASNVVGSTTVGPTTYYTYINIVSASKESLYTNPLVGKATTHTVTPTPTATPSTAIQTSIVATTDDKMDGSPLTVEAGLYTAIVVCAIFVIVIGALMVVIVCLSQRKCKCLGWRISARHKNGQRDRGLGNRVFIGGSEAQSLMRESGGSAHFDNVIDGPRLIRPPVNDHMMPTQQILNKRSLPRGSEKTTSDDQRPPNLPPKPGKLTPSQKGHSTNYDHLELVDESKRSVEQVQKDPSTSDVLMSAHSEIPPKKPPRSRSRDHFYHTLESSDESGLLHSATTSQHSSRMSSRLSHREDEDEGDYSHPRPNRSSVLSEQVKELFDDPRYAVLFVDERDNKGLGDRRELCRSTPSLVQISKPGVPERRSLRTPHKRISILHEPLNDHSHC